jgi:hypothetical protein
MSAQPSPSGEQPVDVVHESFLAYAGFRYLKWSLLICILAIVAYAWHHPPVPPNGGTWLGYTLGTVGALIILLLLWFGIRKRQYRSTAGRVAGWLSAHVYLGVSLVVVATLHSGFQIGWNVHTLTYVLMLIVIVSGIYGVFAYARYPRLMTDNRRGMRSEMMIGEVGELDRECLELADRIGPESHQIMLRSIERAVIGGNAWQQITGRSTSQAASNTAVEDLRRLQREQELAQHNGSAEDQAAGLTMVYMANRLSADMSSTEVADLRRLLELVSRKKALVDRLQRDVQYHALMNAWLFVHVPLSVALLAALSIHVISVFFYW